MEYNNRIDIEGLKTHIQQIKDELAKVIVGQEEFINLLLTAFLADGHVLIEGVPGIAKTITAKLLSKTVKTDFSRIQFTPDLMPADILGTSIFNVKTHEFEFHKGPIFSHFILIDEINRSPAKTQAALFEVMEEKQITIDGKRYEMEEPFFVLATQNPIDQEGTYALPEAQQDRFIFKIKVDYPSLEEEIKIIENQHLRKNKNPEEMISPILSVDQLKRYKEIIQQVVVDEPIIKYIAELIYKTRNHSHLYLGASPRASLSTLNASKAYAAIQGRDYVIPDDIKAILPSVLRHRIILNPEQEMEGYTEDSVIDMIIETIEIPR